MLWLVVHNNMRVAASMFSTGCIRHNSLHVLNDDQFISPDLTVMAGHGLKLYLSNFPVLFFPGLFFICFSHFCSFMVVGVVDSS